MSGALDLGSSVLMLMERIDANLEKTHATFTGIHEVTSDIYTQHFGE